VDKRLAQVLDFDADSTTADSPPALSGRGLADATLHRVGQRTRQGHCGMTGRNRDGKAIVWADCETGFAVHRLRSGQAHAGRIKRLASNGPLARNVSAGRAVAPAALFETRCGSVAMRWRDVWPPTPFFGAVLRHFPVCGPMLRVAVQPDLAVPIIDNLILLSIVSLFQRGGAR